MPEYSYILVRDDLPVAQQIIQACHATHDMAWEHHKPESPTHIVLCEASSEEALLSKSDFLHAHNIPHTLFFEPDISGYTALATKPLGEKDRGLLRKWKLKK